MDLEVIDNDPNGSHSDILDISDIPDISDILDISDNSMTNTIELCYERPFIIKVKSVIFYLYNEMTTTNETPYSNTPYMKIIDPIVKEKVTSAEEKIVFCQEKIEDAQKAMEIAQNDIDNAINELKNIKKKLLLSYQLNMEEESKKVYKYLKENQSNESNQSIESESDFMNFWNRSLEEKLQIAYENQEHAKKMVEYLETDYEKYLEGLPISLKYVAIMMGLSKVSINTTKLLYMNYLKQGFYIEDKTYKMTYIVDIKTLNL